jgi:hypothetical protein
MTKAQATIAIILAIMVSAVITASQVTLFVVQPIGAVPEGRTLLISRLNKTKFIDSADAMCEREMGGVSLLCRMTMLGGVMANSKIYARWPYSETLYSISTGGKSYEK